MTTHPSSPPWPDAVLFGGTGFIGLHLTRHLLEQGLAQRVWLVDLHPPRLEAFPPAVAEWVRSERVRMVRADVRHGLDQADLPARADLVVNLAAVHREPGHRPSEYYETNLAGAEHVCAWAAVVGCLRVAFTSSIAAYGPCDEAKDESALTVPETPYGGSKLVAEQIHRTWQHGAPGRRLVIVRPGVIFGPGEGGNVTRLIRAVLGGYFVYTGNRQTLKAGGYVKDLCESLVWALGQLEAQPAGVRLYNFSLHPVPTLAAYVDAIRGAAGLRGPLPRVPHALLLGLAHGVQALTRPLGLRLPLDPVRVRKLVRSNHVDPAWLRQSGYCSRFPLAVAFRDWRAERPEDWQAGWRRRARGAPSSKPVP